tara:strand:+ start:511 stop:720 length:210 start_codon:yes stop_codon:yes gene_type:complete
MNSLIFGLLAAISLFIFFKLGKVKASVKQTNRDDRINWENPPWRKNSPSNRESSPGRIIEGEAEEVNKD